MRQMFRQLMVLVALFAIPDKIAAMGFTGHCRVIAGEKLPPSAGDPQRLCDEVEWAVRAAAPNVSYKAEVTVLSPSRLVAAIVVNGRPLPEQRFAIMDRDLNSAAIRRFAQSLAVEVAKAVKP